MDRCLPAGCEAHERHPDPERNPDRDRAGQQRRACAIEHTGQDIDIIRRDIERDKILTAQQAKEYGIVDEVISSRKTSLLALSKGA